MTMTTTLEDRPQRRIKLINPRFQVGLMIKFILVNTAVLALFGAALFLFLRGEVEANLRSAHVVYRTVGDMLFPIILTVSLLNLVILSVTIVFIVLNASHRIAGPMFRFNQALKGLGARNLKAMTRIREDDQLVEISVSLERMRGLWAGDVMRLKDLLGDLCARVPSSRSDEVLQKKLEEMAAVLDSYDV
jgi:hypothetical protein